MLATLLLATAVAATAPSDADIQKILAERVDAQRQAVGIVVGIVDPSGRRVVMHGKSGSGAKLDGDTIFEIGSATKVFTALLLADAVARGEVALTDPVAKYLPETVKVPEPGATFRMSEPGGNQHGAVPLHQGGIVDLPNGDWWGFSMMDFRSVGRTTALSPVTWQDGWPYFGLPGNLGRTPRTWTKPAVAAKVEAHAPYERSDDFAGPKLLPVWQWNHNPVNAKWSLTAQPGSTVSAGHQLLTIS